MHLNILKAHDNGFVTDLKPGDEVRIDDTALCKKGTESRWSVVKEASGKTVTLTDGTTHKRSKLLMVLHNTAQYSIKHRKECNKSSYKAAQRQAAIQERKHQRNRCDRGRA